MVGRLMAQYSLLTVLPLAVMASYENFTSIMPDNGTQISGAIEKQEILHGCTKVEVRKVGNQSIQVLSDEEMDNLKAICQTRLVLMQFTFWTTLVLGIPGNILALITILQLGKSTGTFYVALLSAADLVTIIEKTIATVVNRLRANDTIGCKTLQFLTNFTGTYANWVLVLICFERLITIRYPLKKNYYFTLWRAYLSAVFLGVALLPLFIFYLWQFEESNGSCSVQDTNLWQYISYLSMAMFSYLPTLLMFFMVIAIAIEIRKVQKNRKSIFCGPEHTSNSQSNQATLQKLKEQAKVERSITIMLVVASIVFMIMTLPICITIPVFGSNYLDTVSPETHARWSVASTVAMCLTFLTHAVNFFIYFISAGRFRAKLFSLLECKRADDTNTVDNSAPTVVEAL